MTEERAGSDTPSKEGVSRAWHYLEEGNWEAAAYAFEYLAHQGEYADASRLREAARNLARIQDELGQPNADRSRAQADLQAIAESTPEVAGLPSYISLRSRATAVSETVAPVPSVNPPGESRDASRQAVGQGEPGQRAKDGVPSRWPGWVSSSRGRRWVISAVVAAVLLGVLGWWVVDKSQPAALFPITNAAVATAVDKYYNSAPWQNRAWYYGGSHYILYGDHKDVNMYYRMSPDGVNFGEPILFSTLGIQEDRYTLVISGDRMYTVYAGRQSNKQGPTRFRISRFLADGTLNLGEWVTAVGDADWEDFNAGALLSDGKFIITYSEPWENPTGIWARIADVSKGTWTEIRGSPFRLDTGEKHRNSSRVVALADGDAYILTSSFSNLYGRYWDGASLSGVETLAKTVGPEGEFDIIKLLDGRLLLVGMNSQEEYYLYALRDPGPNGKWSSFVRMPVLGQKKDKPTWAFLSSCTTRNEAYLVYEGNPAAHRDVDVLRFDTAKWYGPTKWVNTGADEVTWWPCPNRNYEKVLSMGYITSGSEGLQNRYAAISLYGWSFLGTGRE